MNTDERRAQRIMRMLELVTDNDAVDRPYNGFGDMVLAESEMFTPRFDVVLEFREDFLDACTALADVLDANPDVVINEDIEAALEQYFRTLYMVVNAMGRLKEQWSETLNQNRAILVTRLRGTEGKISGNADTYRQGLKIVLEAEYDEHFPDGIVKETVTESMDLRSGWVAIYEELASGDDEIIENANEVKANLVAFAEYYGLDFPESLEEAKALPEKAAEQFGQMLGELRDLLDL